MEVLTRVDAGRIEPLRGKDEFFWLDLTAPSPGELTAMGEALGLHPLALEDSREFGQRPKLDAYGDHLLLVFYTARVAAGAIEPVEVHLHISGDYLVTIRRVACRELEALHEGLVEQATDAEDYLVYRVLDALTDGFFPVIEAVEANIDALEAEVLERTHRSQLTGIYRLKQDVQELQRIVSPQHAAMAAAEEEILRLPGLTHGSRPYLRDVLDHLEQVRSELGRHAADLSSLADTFFSANQNRLNLLATRLAIIGSLFIAWTLITSFFGQNFGYLVRSVDSRTDFLIYGVGGLVVPAVVLGGLLYWRRKDWW